MGEGQDVRDGEDGAASSRIPESLAIERFARDLLGCRCPDELFERIKWHRSLLPASRIPLLRITIGERLLVDLIPLDALQRPEQEIPILLTKGAATRDGRGLNRYRLALICRERTAATRGLIDTLQPTVERVHLHLVTEAETAGLPLAGLPAADHGAT